MKSSELRLGRFLFQPETGRLADGSGARVELRHQAMEVLQVLAEYPNAVVERDRLLDRVWQNRQGAEEGLVQCVAEIRRVLGDTGKSIVETIPRKGYRLVASPASSGPGLVGRALALFVLAVVLIGSAVAWRVWLWDAGGPVERPVVAVLPFETLDPGDETAGIADAVGDTIISSLAAYSEFDTIARQSSYRFRNSEQSVVEIGEALGADYLVQGSQQLVDRTLRLSVQLIDAADQTLEMVDTFEIALGDMFEANEEIAHRIANTVSGSVLNLHARNASRDGAVDALILDNRARMLFQSGPSREKWLASLEMSDEAIRSYPDAEWGYVGKALMLRTGVRFGWDQGAADAVLDEAEQAARRAIQINPTNYLSHFALGRVLMQRGEIRDSISALSRAAELNPSSAMVLNGLGQSYIYADDSEALMRTVARVRVIDPLPGTLTLWVRAWAEWQTGDCEAAKASVGAMTNVPLEANKLRAVIEICVGNTEAAEAEIAEFLARNPDWTLAREVAANAVNWSADGPRDRWLAALAEAGVPE